MKFLGDLEDYLNNAVADIKDSDESLQEGFKELCDGDVYEITFAPGEEYKVAEYLMDRFVDLLTDYDTADVYNEVCAFVKNGVCKFCEILPCELIVEAPVDESCNSTDLKKEGIWGGSKDYSEKDGWTPEDIELHKSIDWKARNYMDYPVEDDSFVGTTYCYGLDKPLTKEVKMCKFIRSNPIFPPYYAAIEDPFKDKKGIVGPMFDGRKYKSYDIHDRYETQQLYDLLMDKLNFIKDTERKLYEELMMSGNGCDITEAKSYGGAYDIDEYQFFTKEELIDFANSIIDVLKETNINRNIDITDLYMENNNQLTIELLINDYNEKATVMIDMRRISLPRDIEKYKDAFVTTFEDLCKIDKVDD